MQPRCTVPTLITLAEPDTFGECTYCGDSDPDGRVYPMMLEAGGVSERVWVCGACLLYPSETAASLAALESANDMADQREQALAFERMEGAA